MVADGMSNDEIVAEHPDLEAADIREALQFARLLCQRASSRFCRREVFDRPESVSEVGILGRSCGGCSASCWRSDRGLLFGRRTVESRGGVLDDRNHRGLPGPS